LRTYFNIMTIHQFAITGLIAFGFTCCSIPEKEKAELNRIESNQPNIVLIVADDHGSTDLGCYGNPAISTPNLDDLAEEGVRFTRAHCTTASCSASRSVILTGLYNHANGQFGHEHAYHHFSTYAGIKSLPVYLNEAGYNTARIGKYHVGPEEVFKFDTVLKGSGRNAERMADNCVPFLQQTKGKPFFLYFATDDPHRSNSVDSTNNYLPDFFGNNSADLAAGDTYTIEPEDVIVPNYLPDNEATRSELVQYYKSVHRMDKGIGTLFQHLKNEGLWNNTIIVYISDNGIAFPGAKTTLYNAGIRLPCIIRNPYIKRIDSVCDAMINWADLTPTLLDFAGILDTAKKHDDTYDGSQRIPILKGFQGRSFKSVLETGNLDKWNETYASHTFHEITMYYPMRVVISGKYKLIWNLAHELSYPFASDLYASATWQYVLQNNIKRYGKRSVEDYLRRPEFELYDLEQDPDESINLINSMSHQETLRSLQSKIRLFQENTSDPWSIKWVHE
jgi:N-sulfoglucosamine sulfohydrolase